MPEAMKNQLILCLLTLLISVNLAANPIVPENLIAEIYFEDEEWYIALDNMFIEFWGIADFEEVVITCNAGQLMIKDDFLPNLQQNYTILSNEDLYVPIQINRGGDIITTDLESFELTTFEWNDQLPSPVCGPFPGQGLYVWPVMISDWEMEYWLVKNDNPVTVSAGIGNLECVATFEGYVLDLNANPVANANIFYIGQSYIQYPYNQFDELWTDDAGYFEIGFLPARNYIIQKIKKATSTFYLDTVLSLEPGINYHEFIIDYNVGLTESDAPALASVRNFPNPFQDRTIFRISLPPDKKNVKGHITICSLDGTTTSLLPLRDISPKSGAHQIEWARPGGLSAGEYLYYLNLDGRNEARGKMMVGP